MYALSIGEGLCITQCSAQQYLSIIRQLNRKVVFHTNSNAPPKTWANRTSNFTYNLAAAKDAEVNKSPFESLSSCSRQVVLKTSANQPYFTGLGQQDVSALEEVMMPPRWGL